MPVSRRVFARVRATTLNPSAHPSCTPAGVPLSGANDVCRLKSILIGPPDGHLRRRVYWPSRSCLLLSDVRRSRENPVQSRGHLSGESHFSDQFNHRRVLDRRCGGPTRIPPTLRGSGPELTGKSDIDQILRMPPTLRISEAFGENVGGLISRDGLGRQRLCAGGAPRLVGEAPRPPRGCQTLARGS